jgi:chemotaxis protein methyltransferase CheR
MVSDSSLGGVLALIERLYGLDTRPLADSIRNAITERARRAREVTEEYAARLVATEDDGGELADLVSRLLLGHTHFYRHPKVWEWLAHHLKERVGSGPVRALVAGCSTGEEVYTLASLLCSGFGLGGFEVLGVDVNPNSLDAARQGRYLARETRKLPEAWQERFLDVEADGLVRFSAPLRTRVRFAWCNLLRSVPPGSYDLVMIRNVLTYMTEGAVTTIVQRLCRALAPTGVLVVAPQETFLVHPRVPLVPAGAGLPIFVHGTQRDTVPAQRGAAPAQRGEAPAQRGAAPAQRETAQRASGTAQRGAAPAPPGSDPLVVMEALLHADSPAWERLSAALSEALRAPPAALRVDLSAVLRVDNQVKRSIGAAVRLLEAAGTRVEVVPGTPDERG